jgi:DNA-binding transcriptional regulator YhcF (GntR family)
MESCLVDNAIKSKTDQVIDRIRTWLKSGEFKIGDRLPSERELSARLGVSLLTVNKAMARLEDLSLISRSAGRGTHVTYLPSPDAIAVICDICHLSNSYSSPYIDALIANLLKETRDAGAIPHFLIGRGHTAPDFLDSLGFESSIWHSIKGAVAMAWRDGVEDVMEKRGIPLVTISTKDQGKHSIILDYVELGKMAARLIAKSPEGDIGLFYNSCFDELTWNNPAIAFIDEITRLGISPERVKKYPSGESRIAGYELARKLISSDYEPQHLVFTDENIAAGYHDGMASQHSPNRCFITQHTLSEQILPIPSYFNRLSFNIHDICREAIRMLENLRGAASQNFKSCRKMIRPTLFQAEHALSQLNPADAFSDLANISSTANLPLDLKCKHLNLQ